MRLTTKFLLAFALVILTGLGIVSFVASRITARELHGIMMQDTVMPGMGGMMGTGVLGPGDGRLRTATELAQTRINRAILLGALAAGVVAVLAAGFLSDSLIAPLRELSRAMKGIADGTFKGKLWAQSDDEVGDLTDSFLHMWQALERSENARRSMLADLAHELRNPIAVMQANAEAMVDGVFPASPENLQSVLDQTRLLSRLVDDLRTLALADAGQLNMTLAPLDLGSLIPAAVREHEVAARANRQTLLSSLPVSLPLVLGDSQRLTQVLGNMLSNALRHTPEGGRVEVSAVVEGNQVRVSVEDSGPGFAAEELPFVFERFRGKTSDSSTGLGLAIARRIVEAHGGRMEAGNRPEGGASVNFRLPISK